MSPSAWALFQSALRTSTRKDPPWACSTATDSCIGAPSSNPCATSVPLGDDGNPRTFIAADSVPVGESRTERVEVNCACAASAPTGPSVVPDAFRVPASAGDNDFKSRTSRSQLACRIEGLGPRGPGTGLETSPLAVSTAARPVNFMFSSVMLRSVSAPDNCKVALSPTAPDQFSVPTRSAALASRVTCVAAASCNSCALTSALPPAFWPPSAASGPKSGRRSSSAALRVSAAAAVKLVDACRENNRCEADTTRGRAASSSRTAASILTGDSCSSSGRGPGIRKPSMIACSAALPESAVRSASRAARRTSPGSRNSRASICPSARGVLTPPCQRPCKLALSQAMSGRGDKAGESNAKSRSADRSVTLRLPCARPRKAPASMDSSTRSASRGPLKFTDAASAPSPGSCSRFSNGPPAGSCRVNAASIRFGSNRSCNSYSPSPSMRCAAALMIMSLTERKWALPRSVSDAGAPASSAPSLTRSTVMLATSMRGMDTVPLCALGDGSGVRSMSTLAACRVSIWMRRASNAAGDQLRVTRSARSHTPRSSLSSRRSNVRRWGNEPANPDRETWPEVRLCVSFSIIARPESVLPAMNRAPPSNKMSSADAPITQPEILSARRIRRPAPARCRSRGHRRRRRAAARSWTPRTPRGAAGSARQHRT